MGRQRFPINNKKRARDDGSSGPSRSRPKINVKSEELSGNAQEQQIRALQVSQDVVYFLSVVPDEARIQAEVDTLKAALRNLTNLICQA